MQETRVQFLGREDTLEKEMTTHSSILAWKIPWIEEPSGLVHKVARVEHDLAAKPPPSFPFLMLLLTNIYSIYRGFLCGSDGKEPLCSAWDLGSVPELGRHPGERNGYTLQYFCLKWSGSTPWAVAHYAPLSMEFSRWEYPPGDPQPWDRTRVSCITGRCFTVWAKTEEPGRLQSMGSQSQTRLSN